MKIIALLIFALMCASSAYAYPVTAPEGKTLKVHWALLQAKPGKMQEMAAISARTVANYTPNESGSYSLYGAIDAANPDIMRILEIYEDEAAYQVHRDSEGFKAFIDERKPILENLTILPVDPIVLEQKAEGTGKFAYMSMVEVNPEYLDEFKEFITTQMTDTVRNIPGALAMFATSEQGDRANFIHVLGVFTDEAAKDEYLASMRDIASPEWLAEYVESRHVVANKPANIVLSRKGLHFSMLDSLKHTDKEFAEFFGNFAYTEVVKETKLDPRTRYMAIIATLMGCEGVSLFHDILPEALKAGVTPSDVKEIIYQGTAYLGLGRTYAFFEAADDVLQEWNPTIRDYSASTTTPDTRVEKGNAAQVEIFGEGMKGFQNSGPEETRHINRWLAGNCFGDYYTRKGLTLREREMITFCCIAAQGGCEPQLIAHAKGNFNMGNDRAFMIDVVSQCLPYIGYPRSLNAITCINKAAE